MRPSRPPAYLYAGPVGVGPCRMTGDGGGGGGQGPKKTGITFGLSQSSRRPGVKPSTPSILRETEAPKPVAPKGPLVIPLKGDRRPPIATTDAAVDDAPATKYNPKLYGLQVRCQPKTPTDADAAALPLLMRGTVPGLAELPESKRYKRDLQSRPDADADVYSRVPVEEFGAALLRGMGWQEGKQAAGKYVAPIESKPRPKGLGLGADPALLPSAKGARGAGEGGGSANRIAVGGHVHIVGGEHAGMSGIIREMRPSAVKIQLDASGELVSTALGDLSLTESHGPPAEPEGVPGAGWLTVHMHVRITSKTLAAGAYYWRSGRVHDVHTDEDGVVRASVRVSDGRHVLVHQGQIARIAPQVGDDAVVTAGMHRGERGKVLSVAADGVHVQLHDSFDVITLPIDSVALAS